MKRKLLALGIMLAGLSATAQTPRLSLYEEFTGETCPPCASTNPGLNLKLHSATNTPKIVAIKWQVPIPSAPSNTWSLYQTNKTEIDWRWKSIANGGYGYTPAINSAPSSKIDGQEATVFGASSGHPANLNDNVISSAQSHTAAFSITANRAWDATCSAVDVTITIQATANFTAAGSLKFRFVMIEERIEFATQPGTNGEKIFEDAAIKSFPDIQNGTAMASTWTVGQTQTFVLNCPLPSYVRKKEEVGFVGFIQDDGNQKVAQAVRVSKSALSNDAMAVGAKVEAACGGANISPVVTVKNVGLQAITALTITPYADATAGAPTPWTGNIASGATQTIAVTSMASPTAAGAHTFSFDITAISGTDFNSTNNKAKVSFPVASSFQGAPVSEGFPLGVFPPAKWTSVNPDGGTAFVRVTNAGGYNVTPMQSVLYACYNNTVVGDKDELYLPPMDLSGANPPDLTFDVAYAQRNATSDDKLEVFVSDDCGAHWTSVYSKSGTGSLATAAPTPGFYIPDFQQSEWATEVLTLNGFNKPNVLCKFVVTNDNGNNIYLDNVNLSQSAPVGIAKNSNSDFSFNLFPNPANGVTVLNINTPKATHANVTVVNTIGQVVFEKNTELNSGANAINIDAKNMASGVYYVSVETNGGSTVKKLVVSH